MVEVLRLPELAAKACSFSEVEAGQRDQPMILQPQPACSAATRALSLASRSPVATNAAPRTEPAQEAKKGAPSASICGTSGSSIPRAAPASPLARATLASTVRAIGTPVAPPVTEALGRNALRRSQAHEW